MTAQEIAQRLVSSEKAVTPERQRKFVKLCERMNVPMASVMACLAIEDQLRWVTRSEPDASEV